MDGGETPTAWLMFSDKARAESSFQRIGRLVNRDLSGALTSMFGRWPNGEQGLARLERVFAALSSPGGFAAILLESPELAGIVAEVLCSSTHLADVLVQNPELAFLLVDPDALSSPVTREDVRSEGCRMLAHSNGYSHRLDRIRFVKQRYLLLLAAQDICGLRPQPEIWTGLSDLAFAIIELVRDVVWRHVSGEDTSCPLGIVVVGKLGGLELNYSSDIDLIFTVADETTEKEEAQLKKVCETLRSALADRMGRGDLYRIDLRLRPFGSQGPLLSRISALESYYDRYAEPWEHLAHIRSVALGPEPLCLRWEAIRERFAFFGPRNEVAISNLLKMRGRAEDEAEATDLKRGPGGIRDVELCVQIAQMLHAESHPALRGRPTLEMLDEIGHLKIFEPESIRILREGYILLRKVEHRCQIESNRQTYSLPDSLPLRETIAASLGYRSLNALERELAMQRSRIRMVTEELLGEWWQRDSANGQSWLATLPEGETFIRAVRENASSAERIARISSHAPVLIPHLKQSITLVEQIISGEVTEPDEAGERFRIVHHHYQRDEMRRATVNGWLRGILRWLYGEGPELGEVLAEATDEALAVFASRWEGCSVLGLGSYAALEMSPGSDADILVVCESAEARAIAERAVQSSAVELGKLRSLGAPLEIDFRLRPEGRAGRLVSTPESLSRYAAERMEPWERFALGRARTVYGSNLALDLAHEIAYAKPIGPAELNALVGMKSRIERERVKPGQYERHVKLGRGGLDDISWLLQLWLLRRPDLCQDRPVKTAARLKCLFRAGILDAVEHDTLLDSHRFLIKLRNRLYLLGVGDDLIPENPDKLAFLARGFGAEDANGMLKLYQRHTGRVRGIFEQGMEALAE